MTDIPIEFMRPEDKLQLLIKRGYSPSLVDCSEIEVVSGVENKMFPNAQILLDNY